MKRVTLKDTHGVEAKAANRGSKAKNKGMLRRIPSQCELKLNNLKKPTDIDDVLFDFLTTDGETISVARFWSAMTCTGIQSNDPRLQETRQKLCEEQIKLGMTPDMDQDFQVDRETFKECVHDNIVLVGQVFKKDVIIPEFYDFIEMLETIFNNCRENVEGEVSNYIPQLQRTRADQWGVSICTIDGQRYSFGDADARFTLQACCKPLNYGIAVTDLGPKYVHSYVGQEPSGRGSSALNLDNTNKPHNPMINSGGIIATSLLKPEYQTADRFDYVFEQYKRAAGFNYVGFHNSSYLSAVGAADRDFALSYYMRENKCYPEKTDIVKNLELYFQLSSIEVTAESASVMAATLANGGICPLTYHKVFSGEAVRDTMSLMYSCGMYDHSGQFAFTVGLPAKSSQSGAILLVIPNVMGICLWSPRLDSMGNSCRGVQFCEELVNIFNFHNYDNLKHTGEQKRDPRIRKVDTGNAAVITLLSGAHKGDIRTVRRFALSGIDLNRSDYDGRTALHLAAAEGHLNIVRLLLEKFHVSHDPRDRWNFTPVEDARKFKKQEVVQYLEDYEKRVSRK